MSIQNICAAALAAAAFAGGAQAATYTATSVIDDNTTYGACTASPAACAKNDRQDPTNSLGGTDGSFYALGLGGQLELAFAAPLFAPGAMITLEEVTFGGPIASGHFEAVDVYSVLGGVATLVDTVTNATATTTLYIAQSFEYIRLVDVTLREFASTLSGDGFDVDSVTITGMAAVPVPAGGALLLSGLGGLAMMRRRRAAS